MKIDDVHSHTQKPSGLGWIVTFADLICLLLAFFVMLFSLSTINEPRTKAVIDSVSQAFTIGKTNGAGEPFTGGDGAALAARDLEVELARVFAAAIPAAEVDILRPGRLMQVEFLVDALFLPGTADVRTGQIALLDRLVAAGSNPPPGQRIEMEVTIGTPQRRSVSGAEEALAIARASAFARAMITRGLGEQAIRAGVEMGSAGHVRLSFHLLGNQPSPRPQ